VPHWPRGTVLDAHLPRPRRPWGPRPVCGSSRRSAWLAAAGGWCGVDLVATIPQMANLGGGRLRDGGRLARARTWRREDAGGLDDALRRRQARCRRSHRSANGTAASVGRVGRIMRSRHRSGWRRLAAVASANGGT